MKEDKNKDQNKVQEEKERALEAAIGHLEKEFGKGAVMLYLENSNYASSSVSRSVASIRSFYQYMLKKEIVSQNPSDELKPPKIEKKAPEIMKEIPYTKLNGDPVKRLPNNINVCFRYVEGESMLIMLDMKGIAASSGSACTSGSLDPSHVLLAIGLPHEIAHGSLRLTLSEEITKEQADFTVDSLKGIISNLRSMSPLYEDFVKKQEAASAK